MATRRRQHRHHGHPLGSSSTGNKEFATTSGGSTVTSVTLPANTQSVVAYYGDNKSGPRTITAAGSGLVVGHPE
jgi:hypothetical protein